MPFTDNKGLRLHWDEGGPTDAGAATATPLLLVMGHRYSSAMWHPAIPGLTAARRVVWFDNRGTGESGFTRDAEVADMAADAFAVMDAAGIDKAHIFGVSMGGVIVQEMVRQQPDRIISLIVGCSGILSADKPRANPAARWLIYHLPPPILRMLTGGPERAIKSYGSAADPAAVAHDMEVLAKDPYVTAGVLAQAKAMSRYTIDKQTVAAMTLPSLVLHGDEDATVPFAYSEELAATLPNCRFVRLQGAGHNFLVARKAETVAAVTGFLSEVDAGAFKPS